MGTNAKPSPEPWAQGVLGLGTDGKCPWPWGRRGESEPAGGLPEALGQGHVRNPSGRAAVTAPEVISSSCKLQSGNLGPTRSCESEVELGKGSLSLPQGLAGSKTRADCPPPLRSPRPCPPSAESKYGSLCCLYNKGWAGVFPGDTKSAFPEGAVGVSPWASEKIGRAGVRIERRSHLDLETSHEAFLQRPPLPAPVTGDSAEGPWREPPPRVTLGEKLMGLNVPQASQVQETQEGQGHRAWLAAASQARSGCEFEGGRIAARPGLLSSTSPSRLASRLPHYQALPHRGATCPRFQS